MMRVDLLLVEKGLAPSRNRAQELIDGGKVYVVEGGARRRIAKSSLKLEREAHLEIDFDETQYVSRGGLKLKGAIERRRLDVRGFRILDIGISTGGFADCLLQAGAASVVGVDVGHDQLAAKLKQDARVHLFEGVNARQLGSCPLLEANGGNKFDLIVIDVSFISLALVLPETIQYLEESGHLLALVKPQFEVGKENLGKKGIVKDTALYPEVEARIRKLCEANGLSVEDYFESSILGSDGNREFFIFARPAQLLLGAFRS